MSRKILFIHHGTAHGGAPLSLLYTAMGAKEAGYEVKVALAYPSDELRSLYQSKGISTIDSRWISIFHYSTGAPMPLMDIRSWYFYFSNFRKWRLSKRLLLELIDKESIDIVHLNSMALVNSAIALLKSGVPFVWHVREPAISHRSLRGSFVSRILLRCKNVIFISKEDQESWLGAGVSHGTVIHNFIDFNFFSRDKVSVRAQGQRSALGSDVLTILYVGGISKVKGIIPLLLALHQLKENNVPFYCLMPGSLANHSLNSFKKLIREYVFDDFRLIVENLISKLGLSDNLIMEHFDPDLRLKYAMADVVVFPSIRRHFARPIIEAAAMAKPVVASDFPGIRELVEDKKTGFLVPPNNASALADKLMLFYQDRERSYEMGQNALHWGKERFNSAGQMKKILEIYARL